ncbi:transmembrane protein 6/97 [Halteromyces radiatus]|uniref:transmembrane protein 6/97 n=1 Tax=Halteromyces radiatus TaxID=101107 RepID=UPI00221F7A28|nr:transmembrane protein 6/97 [Halteromyces radiatus]KAI8099463.1 transmembrane protein 6/97 [Halteromyces radiatus]
MTFTERRLDLVFFIFFITHIPITIFFDLQSIYPKWLVPSVLQQILNFYAQTTNDPFMNVAIPRYWFQALVSMEALCQLPFFFVASYALYYNMPFIRLPLIVYGSHVVTTVVPVLAELLLNPTLVGLEQDMMKRWTLVAIYSPYLLIPLVLLVDSYRRVSNALVPKFKSN